MLHNYTAVGILGATVMPHSLFLGSALATQDRLSPSPKNKKLASLAQDNESKSSSTSDLTIAMVSRTQAQHILHAIKECICAPFRVPSASEYSTRATCHADRENKPYSFVKAHIYHGIVDVVTSLLGFAVLINSLFVCLHLFFRLNRSTNDNSVS